MYGRLCLLLGLAGCQSQPADASLWDSTTAPGAVDPCLDALDHQLSVADCAVLEPAPCEPGLNVQVATSPLFDDIFSECLLHEIVLTVQLDGGCAARFSMNRSDPESIACVSARLEGPRFDCPGELRCVRGERSTLR